MNAPTQLLQLASFLVSHRGSTTFLTGHDELRRGDEACVADKTGCTGLWARGEGGLRPCYGEQGGERTWDEAAGWAGTGAKTCPAEAGRTALGKAKSLST